MGKKLRKPSERVIEFDPDFLPQRGRALGRRRINPAEGRDAFKSRELEQSRRDAMRRSIENSKKVFEDWDRRNLDDINRKRIKNISHPARHDGITEMSGGELKSMVKNKEAEMRDRTPLGKMKPMPEETRNEYGETEREAAQVGSLTEQANIRKMNKLFGRTN